MALQKNYTHRTGAVSTVYRIQGFSDGPNEFARYASVIISAYVNAASPQDAPLVPVFAKLRIEGAAYARLLSKAALAASQDDIYGILYRALKDGPTADGVSIIGDCQSAVIDGRPQAVNFFADAVDA